MACEEEYAPMLSEAVIPLADVLTDEYSEVAFEAAYTLELLGPAAQAALPRLRQVAESGDDALRTAASNAIGSMGG
jgi:HEAT repeat protein